MAQTPAVHLPLVIVNLVYLSAISLFLKHLKQEAAQLKDATASVYYRIIAVLPPTGVPQKCW